MKARGFEGRIEVSECLFIPDKPLGAVRAIYRQALIEFLDKCTELQHKRGKEVCGFTITMPCGFERRFTNHCDIPFGDLRCGCGREDHYLIRYNLDEGAN